MQDTQLDNDSKDLKQLGYVQELYRDMGGFSNFAISFSVISILTGATQLYGYGLQHGGPLQMSLGWLLVSFFTMSVALSMSELASAYPTSGALYHWSSWLGGRTLGWFTACFNSIGLFAVLAGVDYGLAQFLIALMDWKATALTTGGIFVLILFSHALLNHVGIRIVSWLNGFSAWYHMAVVAVIIGVLSSRGFVQPLSFLTQFNHIDGFLPLHSFLIGLLLAQWTFTGFDASAHTSEETRNPKKNAPWGIVISVAVSIIFGFLMLAAVTLSISDLTAATKFGDNAFFEILKLRLGNSMATLLTSLVAGAMWLCGLASMTSASRMIYAFSRDRGLPFWRLWSSVSTKFHTPVHAIWLLAMLASMLALSLKLYSAVVSVATIALYLSYGLPIFARLRLRLFNRETHEKIGPWNLGKLSFPISIIAIIWISFISILFVLPPNDLAGLAIGILFFILLALWFLVVRKRFEGPPHRTP